MSENVRGSANRQTQARYKARLVVCLLSLSMIPLTGRVSLCAQTDRLAKNGDAHAQGAGESRGLSPSQDSKADWWSINKAVLEQLSVNDLGEVIKSLPQAPPIGDVVELLRELNLFVRAGHRHRATQVIDRLPKDADATYQSLLSHVGDFLIGREEWDLARRFLERAPQAEPGWSYVLIKRWAEKGDPAEIDRWLAARMEENYSYWLFERLRFRTQLRTESELLDILAKDVKAHPADLARARRYVNAVETVGNKFNLDWMGDTCKPAFAFECYQLGNAVAPRSPRAAIPLFERALSLPFTDQDKKLLHENIISRLANSFVFLDWENAWRDWTKQELARSYKSDDQANKAQPIIEELTAAYPNGLPDLGLLKFAGVVQGESGARVIEGRILKAEARNADSGEYWLTRAEYYAGRKEKAKAVEAFEKALVLTPFVINGTDDRGSRRLSILLSYANFLGGPVWSPEAMHLLRREFEGSRLDTSYADWLVRAMTHDQETFTQFFGAEVGRLWDYLAAQRQWAWNESMLLKQMLNALTPAKRELFWARAEKLATMTDPTRAYILGEVMVSNEAQVRAIPLLKDAIQRLVTDNEKEQATHGLYRAYIETDNWKAAEEMWPSLNGGIRPNASPDSLGEIAFVAARAQSPDEAMRFWRAKANLDRGDFRYLSDLARLGLKERLRSFYQHLAKDDPECWAPKAALQLLQ
ncbi:MAG: hypothetical protein MOB07_29600 [Acidobacteria bacterium]|nr:hypothetical protein [Acidobacteriota bacterium]